MSEEQNSGIRALLIVVAAICIVVGGIAAVAHFGKKPPVIKGQIIRLDAVPMHSEMRAGMGAQGTIAGTENYDQVIVLAEVELHNQSEIPFYLHEMAGSLTTSDGVEQRDLAVGHNDFQSAFIAYPKLAPLRQEPLQRDTTIAPGQSVRGMVIFHYDITGQQWNEKQAFKVVLSFLHENDVELPWNAGDGK